MLSAICFKLDLSKILYSGNGLKNHGWYNASQALNPFARGIYVYTYQNDNFLYQFNIIF